jgi:hypothetical protein
MKRQFSAILLALALASAAPAAQADNFILELTGSPALLVKISCTVPGSNDDYKIIKFQSFVPRKYLLQYGAVACTVQKWDARGRLRVFLREDSTIIAFAETAAAYNYVTVRTDGPWGKAAGLRGGIAFPPVTRTPAPTSSSIPGAVPPLNPPLVPPLNVEALPPTNSLQ